MNRMVLAGALVILGSALGCTGGGSDLTGITGALPACSYASGLGTVDAPVSGACTAARALLSCDGSDGTGRFCLSEGLGQCPSPDPPTPGTTYSCADSCGAGEYAVSCGVGAAAGPSPPSGCRIGLASPGGPIYCCPCG